MTEPRPQTTCTENLLKFVRVVFEISLFEYPQTSRAGFVVALLSVTITLVSIVLFCIETLPTFATSHCVKDEAPNFPTRSCPSANGYLPDNDAQLPRSVLCHRNHMHRLVYRRGDRTVRVLPDKTAILEGL